MLLLNISRTCLVMHTWGITINIVMFTMCLGMGRHIVMFKTNMPLALPAGHKALRPHARAKQRPAQLKQGKQKP